MHRIRWARAFVLVTLTTGAGRATAQQSTLESDEVMKYRLTNAGLAKFTQAVRNLNAAATRDPSAFHDDSSLGDEPTLDELARAYDRRPVLRQAITSARFTSREFVLFWLSLVGAGLGRSWWSSPVGTSCRRVRRARMSCSINGTPPK